MKPTFFLLGLIAAVAILGALPFTNDLLLWFSAGVVGLALLDLLVAWRKPPNIDVQRVLRTSCAINRSVSVNLKVLNKSSQTVQVKILDECPSDLNPLGAVRAMSIGPHQASEFEYSITPFTRGRFTFAATILLIRSPIKLWDFKRTLDNQSNLSVYPDFAAISKFLALAQNEQTAQLGVRLMARRGTGMEFHQLREYRLGDPINHLDWNATAKRHKLISREYQDERDQNVCILLDSGMLMRHRDGDLSSFDHALNALILVSYVALRQGDSVTVQFFGNSNKYLPSVKGANAINTLLNEVFDVQNGPVWADYISAVEVFLKRQRRRSMVLFITSTRQRQTDLPLALKHLSMHHLTVLANLLPREVNAITERSVRNLDDAFLLTERAHYLDDRRHVRAQCEKNCQLILECTPPELLVQLINSYWQLKRSGAF